MVFPTISLLVAVFCRCGLLRSFTCWGALSYLFWFAFLVVGSAELRSRSFGSTWIRSQQKMQVQWRLAQCDDFIYFIFLDIYF